MLEHLRYLRSKSDSTDAAVRDVKSVVNSLREDVHGLRGDLLRHERALAALEADMERIKNRLDLTD